MYTDLYILPCGLFVACESPKKLVVHKYMYSPTLLSVSSIIQTCLSLMTVLVRMCSECGQGLLGVWRKG